jgi:hypothetical protein
MVIEQSKCAHHLLRKHASSVGDKKDAKQKFT